MAGAEDPEQGKRTLQLITGERDDSGALVTRVRALRCRLARCLRALQAAHGGLASWPDEVAARFAHDDAVTARYIVGLATDDEARDAMAGLGRFEEWLLDQLTLAERSCMRAFELCIRVPDEALIEALVSPDRAVDDPASTWMVGHPTPRSLRTGLWRSSEGDLAAIAKRLGVRFDPSGAIDRERVISTVAHVLSDDGLLRILVATLPPTAQRLLASLVRHSARSTLAQIERCPANEPPASHEGASAEHQLRRCAFAFVDRDLQSKMSLWVPPELQRRLDGLLRAIEV